MNGKFEIVGIRPLPTQTPSKARRWYRGKPLLSLGILLLIFLGCIVCECFIPRDPTYMDLANHNVAPNRTFLFGTDAMGRDIFSMIWYGGRYSLFIGVVATVISTLIGIVFGAASGCAPTWLDALLMRLLEILISIPDFLIIVLLQAVLGKDDGLRMAFTIGIVGWTGIAKVVRAQVRQIRDSEFILAAKCMGGGFFHILWKHLLPGVVSSIMFMVVMNIRGAISIESTLSFMGIGLPLEVVTWGSMLSLSENALLSGAWWMILIPGAFLVTTFVCMTDLGNYLRRNMNRKESNL